MLNCLFNIFNFGNLTFVVNLGIILLLTGLIMLYVRNKFSTYDRCLEEQSNMLRHLITTLQNQQYNSVNAGPNTELASDIAIKTARKINYNRQNNKIIVSDDEDDSEDYTDNNASDDENNSYSTDSENDTESETDTETDSENERSLASNNHNNNIQELNVTDMNDHSIETIETKKNIINAVSMMGLNNVMGGVQVQGGIGGICYLELLSELKDTSFHNDNDNDLNQCIKVISIKSSDENNNEGKIFELNDNQDDSNILDESFIVSKLKETKLDSSITNLIENKEVNDTLDKFSLEQLRDMKKTQLQDLCKKKNLGTNGTRNELITRLSNVL
jgi:hypothetical protein